MFDWKGLDEFALMERLNDLSEKVDFAAKEEKPENNINIGVTMIPNGDRIDDGAPLDFTAPVTTPDWKLQTTSRTTTTTSTKQQVMELK